MNVILRNHTLAAIESTDLAALLPHLSECQLERGAVLIRPGDPVVELFFPTTVFLATNVTFSDGRSALTFVTGADGVCGLAPFLAEQPSVWGVEVKSSGGAYRLPACELRRQMEGSPGLRKQLLRLSYDYQAQAAYGVGCAALHGSMSRLASFLLRSADRLGSDELNLTQQDVADFLGQQRTTVNAAAKGLKAVGAIRYNRGTIQITDREALIQEACECYEATKGGHAQGNDESPSQTP